MSPALQELIHRLRQAYAAAASKMAPADPALLRALEALEDSIHSIRKREPEPGASSVPAADRIRRLAEQKSFGAIPGELRRLRISLGDPTTPPWDED